MTVVRFNPIDHNHLQLEALNKLIIKMQIHHESKRPSLRRSPRSSCSRSRALVTLAAILVVHLFNLGQLPGAGQLAGGADLRPALNHNNHQQQQQQQQQPPQSRIGLAPHDRPACQLPLVAGQRRLSAVGEHSSSLSSEAIEHFNSTSASTLANPDTLSSLLLGKPAKLSSQAVITGNTIKQHQFDSSERLRLLRGLLAQNNYDAYLVSSSDEHGSEYVADADRRVKFVSGFTGSAGYALILLDRAVLFTDGRYALQADSELDCNWWLVVGDNPLADIHMWLKANAAQGIKLSASARLMSMQSFDYLEEQIRGLGSKFELTPMDFVDEIREKLAIFDVTAASLQPGSGASTTPVEPLIVHPLQFSGNVSWQEKVLRLVDAMARLKARHYVISQLDEVAWLLNLRGNDIPQSPLFKAFIIVSVRPNTLNQAAEPNLVVINNSNNNSNNNLNKLATSQRPAANGAEQLQQTLQHQQQAASQFVKLSLFVDLRKIDQQVWDHLRVSNISIVQRSSAQAADYTPSDHQSSTTITTTRIQVDLEDYNTFIKELGERLTPSNPKHFQGRLLLNAAANVAIHAMAKEHEDRLVVVESLVNKLKAVKSDADVQGMRLAHWRDSLAISMLLAQLDTDIGTRKQTTRWNEVSAARELEFYRSLMDFNRGQSFDTISAYGSNAAIVHYRPNYEAQNEQEHRLIGNQSTYLLDSGGQYLDGTTDITRTVHFGEPTDFQRETYTRVLMGAIDMMSLIFDQSRRVPFRLNDILARRHLFELGLDYAHGTGHGIGLYSLVHESPALIEHYSAFSATGQRNGAAAPPGGGGVKASAQAAVESQPILLQPNMFTSVEPGYYKPNDFGIRLENIVVTQRVNQKSSLSRPNDRSQVDSGAAATTVQQQQQQQQQQRQFLRFEPISLVPFEPKLIKFELLSNKQKSWLNSYNLMVRLRMTQQINHYLAKIRSAPSSSGSSAGAGQPIAVRGVSSSSRLHQQLLAAASGGTSNGSFANQAHSVVDQLGQHNYMRLDSSRLQEKLEQTHKWIMSKTELIPLDVPQSFIATRQQQQHQEASSAAGPASAHGGPLFGRRRVGADLVESMSGQRLMLAYMSSMPFNDAEAGLAMASLSEQQEQLELNARAENNASSTPTAGSSGAGEDLAKLNEETNKCSGFECDIWLVSALNSHPSRQSTRPTSSSSSSSKRSSSASSWQEMGDAGGAQWSSSSSSAAVAKPANELAGSLLDMFSLRDPNESAATGPGISIGGGLWSVAVLSLIVVLQVGIIALMCNVGAARRRGGAGRRRNWCPNPLPFSEQPSASGLASPAPSPPRAAGGSSEHAQMRREESVA